MKPARSKQDAARCCRPLYIGMSRGFLARLPARPAFAVVLFSALKRMRAGVYAGVNVILGLVLLAACTMPGDAAPIIKVGLIAPFEGLGRPLGYAVLPAVKLALAQANAAGELGSYRVALVALNDDGEPAASAAQARALAQDPDVVAALGPWGSDTAAAVAPVLREAGVAALAVAPQAPGPGLRSLCPPPEEVAQALLAVAGGPGGGPPALAGPSDALQLALRTALGRSRFGVISSTVNFADQARIYTGDAAGGADQLRQWRAQGWRGRMLGGPDLARDWFGERAGPGAEGSLAVTCAPGAELPADFTAGYRAQAGMPPGPDAVLAYYGTRLLLQAAAADIARQGRPTREGVAVALAQEPVQTQALALELEGGQWAAAPR
jgi:ABC-type branched-subunit amino acid transport system substrate-binding protein